MFYTHLYGNYMISEMMNILSGCYNIYITAFSIAQKIYNDYKTILNAINIMGLITNLNTIKDNT